MAAKEEKVPTGRWARLSKIAGAGARMGASFLKDKALEKAVDRAKSGDGLLGEQAAKRAAAAFGNLRGVAAKAGQMAAYVDGLVPEQHKEAYEKWMSSLLDKAPKSSPEDIRRVIKEELNSEVDELFASFEDVPIASASIGQVHKATLKDGTPVAVKVQHPGVEAAMNADLGNFKLLESMTAAFGSRSLDSQQMLQEFSDRLREELDYTLEAKRQGEFREIHDGDPTIWVPKVFASHSARRVLTTELVAGGMNFTEACAAPEAERALWCETLWRYVFKATILGGLFNADPHPGNYIFLPKGRIAFLDYGCIQPQPPERRKHAKAVHLAAIAGDEAAFETATVAILQTHGGEYEAWALKYVRHCFKPLFASPYRITRPYAATMVEKIQEISLRAPKIKDGSIVMTPGMFFMNRLQCGFYSVLARLDAEVDYARVERDFLVDGESSTPVLAATESTTTAAGS